MGKSQLYDKFSLSRNAMIHIANLIRYFAFSVALIYSLE